MILDSQNRPWVIRQQECASIPPFGFDTYTWLQAELDRAEEDKITETWISDTRNQGI